MEKMKSFNSNCVQKMVVSGNRPILTVHLKNSAKVSIKSKTDDRFFLTDLCNILKERDIYCPIINIGNFDMEQDKKSDMLNKFCSQFDEDTLIITTAYLSTEEFPETEYYLCDEEPSKKKLPVAEVLQRECNLLEAAGFINVNKYVQYEWKVAYIYRNKIGQQVADIMLKSA